MLLATYGILEIAIAALAVPTPLLFSALDDVYPAVISSWNLNQPAVAVFRCCLALVDILPPTILMGATLPVLS